LGRGCRSVVSEPVDASRAAVVKVVANEAFVTGVESVEAAGLVVSSLLLLLLANLGLSAREQLVLLADEAMLAVGWHANLLGIVPASVAEFGNVLRADIRGPGREKVNFLAEVVLVEALGGTGS
jgi:hypothetical protein